MSANLALPAKDFQVGNDKYNLKKLAESCISKIKDYDPKSKFTDSVIFNQKPFQKWLDAMSGADTIKAHFGIYTPEFIAAVNALKGEDDGFGSKYIHIDPAKYEGRLTVFFFAYDASDQPYKIGTNESAGYNLGNLHP